MPLDEKTLPVSTSIPPEFPEEQQALFRETLLALEKGRVAYAVSGAFALHMHTGIWRRTKDLDLFLTAEEAPRAVASLVEAGFECETCDPIWLFKAHRDDFFVDLITGMSNAVITVDPSWIDNARPALVLGVETRVLAAEELLACKLFVLRRERFDGADIAHLVYATRGNLNWKRILSLAGDHWDVLLYSLVLYRYVYPAQTGYVPPEVWNELLSRFRNAVAHPDLKAPFRGSLVDDNMFAIDVAEWGLENVLEKNRAEQERKLARIDGTPAGQALK